MAHEKKQQQKEKHSVELQTLLNQEITLRQDLLANLTEQEYLIMAGNIDLKKRMHLECTHLARKLQSQSRLRHHVTKELIALSLTEAKHMTLEHLLDPTNEHEAECLMLYQKLILLTDKIHIQEARNKTLSQIVDTELVLNQGEVEIDPTISADKEKPFLLTIDYPEEKE